MGSIHSSAMGMFCDLGQASILLWPFSPFIHLVYLNYKHFGMGTLSHYVFVKCLAPGVSVLVGMSRCYHNKKYKY